MSSAVSFPDLLKDKVFTVSEYVDFLNNVLAATSVTIQGEIGAKTNLYARFGYFSILDNNNEAILDCFAWRNVIDAVGIPLEEGMEVRVHGYPSIYKQKGKFSFQVKEIELVGEGVLKKQFDVLKQKLESEGLFDPTYKQSIVDFPTKIGLITSAQARGAKKDFLHNLIARNIEISFYDVRVEGQRSVSDIVFAIQWFNQHRPALDVLVITRGGGSWESLQAFNNEELARAIFASKIPIMVGVGHEDDVSIADFVCDMRASTPTDAAKRLSVSWQQLPFEIDQYQTSLHSRMHTIISDIEHSLDKYTETFSVSITMLIDKIRQQLSSYQEIFELSNPLMLLQKGYSIVRSKEGTIITSVIQLKTDDTVTTEFNDGSSESKIISTKNYS
ncbi:exodeoxyribonuclease VII large subunit [candidate division WWE3 bacterium CG22_combo_CG10-13_8_21_14_all_39_12]|uniref:Exodeoxyribonuclease 7 large subunit n=2 Tax=Katanobacteria TaxID=422282 RepID=A0A2H0BFW7_UNCKA|nr:MAG: exodeoxyribonuclease VII large subunit [candidate division WWE3 bacterium CG22_combo_CG10-13_8_21_14_all_39_12]